MRPSPKPSRRAAPRTNSCHSALTQQVLGGGFGGSLRFPAVASYSPLAKCLPLLPRQPPASAIPARIANSASRLLANWSNSIDPQRTDEMLESAGLYNY